MERRSDDEFEAFAADFGLGVAKSERRPEYLRDSHEAGGSSSYRSAPSALHRSAAAVSAVPVYRPTIPEDEPRDSTNPRVEVASPGSSPATLLLPTPPPAVVPSAPRETQPWVDPIRCLACMTVICGHTFAHISMVHDMRYSAAEATVMMFFATTAWLGVPMFFMISGYLLLPRKQPSYREFYSRRVPRIVIPLAIWSFAYYVWDIFFFNNTGSVTELLRLLATSYLADHLWFLYVMMYLYLVTPMLSDIIQYAEHTAIVWCLALWFVTDPINAAFFDNSIEYKYQFQGVRGTWVGLFLIGGLASFYPRFSRKVLAACLALSLSTGVFIGYGSYLLSYRRKVPAWDYRLAVASGAPVLLMSVPLFFVLRQVFQMQWYTSRPRLMQAVRYFAEHTYGMYLLHMAVQDITAYFHTTENMYKYMSCLYSGPLFSFVLTFFSFAATWLLKRVPVVGPYLVG